MNKVYLVLPGVPYKHFAWPELEGSCEVFGGTLGASKYLVCILSYVRKDQNYIHMTTKVNNRSNVIKYRSHLL
jgi:hypothetical protein